MKEASISLVQNPHVKKIGVFLSHLNRTVYRDVYLLSNQVLSRNPFTSALLEKYTKGDSLPKVTWRCIAVNTIRYYCASFKSFFSYCIEYALGCRINREKFNGDYELIVLDTYLQLVRLRKDGRFIDHYFPGMTPELRVLKRKYVFIPVIDGVRSCFRFRNIAELLRASDEPVITEYQLLTIGDLFEILRFILLYPFHVIALISSLRANVEESAFVRAELADTLNHVTFHSYSRFLQGRGLRRLKSRSIKIISWYENQVVHKNFYRGVRSAGVPCRIYGAQLFNYSPNILNLQPDESEAQHQTLPDILVVNGPVYRAFAGGVSCRVGPSLRYARLFTTSLLAERKIILILLPYYWSDALFVLSMLPRQVLSGYSFVVKAHPAMHPERFQHQLPDYVKLSDEDHYSLFRRTFILVGMSSGTLLEAASLGISVIVVRRGSGIDYSPLPEYGKNTIWHEVTDAGSFCPIIKNIKENIPANRCLIDETAMRYKSSFFCQPSPSLIRSSFDLEKEVV